MYPPLCHMRTYLDSFVFLRELIFPNIETSTSDSFSKFIIYCIVVPAPVSSHSFNARPIASVSVNT